MSAAERLVPAVREFLRTHPGASKRQLKEGVDGRPQDVEAALAVLISGGEAEYRPPERPGLAGACVLVEEPVDTGAWKPAVRCPSCGKPPAVRFTGREVRRAKRERQSARMQTARCARCGTVYWIQARHVAAATLDMSVAAA